MREDTTTEGSCVVRDVNGVELVHPNLNSLVDIFQGFDVSMATVDGNERYIVLGGIFHLVPISIQRCPRHRKDTHRLSNIPLVRNLHNNTNIRLAPLRPPRSRIIEQITSGEVNASTT